MSEKGGQPEDQRERVNRELGELLQELRVALPGVQVLFAFLLTVPFSQGFVKTTTFQRDLFFATLAATAVSTALLIAPSAWHRIHFRQKNCDLRPRAWGAHASQGSCRGTRPGMIALLRFRTSCRTSAAPPPSTAVDADKRVVVALEPAQPSLALVGLS
jgi:hypothetical protein